VYDFHLGNDGGGENKHWKLIENLECSASGTSSLRLCGDFYSYCLLSFTKIALRSQYDTIRHDQIPVSSKWTYDRGTETHIFYLDEFGKTFCIRYSIILTSNASITRQKTKQSDDFVRVKSSFHISVTLRSRCQEVATTWCAHNGTHKVRKPCYKSVQRSVSSRDFVRIQRPTWPNLTESLIVNDRQVQSYLSGNSLHPT
jgi:hypothetical protein